MQGTHAVELAEMQPGLLCQVGAHVLITDGGHLGNVSIVPFNPALVVGDVLGIEQLVRG